MMFSHHDVVDYEFSSKKEFLLVGRNSYSSSSLAGNTRKYHGLFVRNGFVYLSALDEYFNGKRISCASYKNAILDDGLKYLFSYTHPARFLYFVDGTYIEKVISIGENGVEVSYYIWNPCESFELEIVPLVSMRDVHSVRKDYEDVSRTFFEDCVKISSSSEQFEIEFFSKSLKFDIVRNDCIYYDVFYIRDFERGYECCENLYAPMRIKVRDNPESDEKIKKFTIYAGVEGESCVNCVRITSPHKMLEVAADAFIKGDYIYAGYHWFTEPWGRDTFVSLPGILLERGLFGIARKVFLYFARRMKNGLIPNRILKGYSYNSSDASLWYIYALKKYLEKTGDMEFFYRVKVYVEEILNNYPLSDVAELKGSLIKVEPYTTWMDTSYTPRSGLPVEINALWINALKFAEDKGIDVEVEYRDALDEFLATFWNREYNRENYLNDMAGDSSIRPNQVIATAILTEIVKKAELDVDDIDVKREIVEISKGVCRCVEKHLLTPYGLRTLSPTDTRYVGTFCGDKSYHNGCVWPWLIGFYVETKLNIGEHVDSSMFKPLMAHLNDAGLGFISEIFDGDPPHKPGGCIAQAWSVAEVYRAMKLLKKVQL